MNCYSQHEKTRLVKMEKGNEEPNVACGAGRDTKIAFINKSIMSLTELSAATTSSNVLKMV